MGLIIIILATFFGLNYGEFDVTKVGELHFVHTTVSDGRPIYYEWRVPADEIQPILKQMVPKDPKYDGFSLVFGSQTATLLYDGKEIPISWCQIKMVDPVVLITVRGVEYMLKEPNAGKFYDVLEKHRKIHSQQVGPAYPPQGVGSADP